MHRINHMVDECLMDMRLIDMRCKHAVRSSNRGNEVIRLSTLIGYPTAEWGRHVGHVDIEYHVDVILKMDEDDYDHPERIIICDYGFMDEPCIWIDNLHSAVHYVHKHGIGAKLKDIPFYVVDLTGGDPVVYENGSFDASCFEGAVRMARKRQKRSNLKELIDLDYRFGDFLADNPVLLTRMEYFGTEGMSRDRKQT